LGLAGVGLEPHALFLEAHLGLHAVPSLGLGKPHLLLALARDLLLFTAADPILFLTVAALDVLTSLALGVLAGLAFGLDPRPRVRLFLANAVVLDPTELLQGEEDRILTLLGHVVRSPTGDNKPAPLFSYFYHETGPASA